MNAPSRSPFGRRLGPHERSGAQQLGAKQSESVQDTASNRPAKGRPVRVMIVDDSLTVRTIFKRMVEGDPAMIIVGTASSGERAIVQIKKEPADVVLLDLEMPGMGGLKALPEILNSAPDAQVLVVSSLTQDGAEATLAALASGAADTLQKPRPGGFNEEYRSQLLGKIRALGQPDDHREPETAPGGKLRAKTGAETGAETGAAIGGTTTATQAASIRSPTNERPAKRPEVIAIGASTGGIHALNLMLRELSPQSPQSPQCTLPIVITQHLPSNFIPVFARQIEIASGRPTRIAEDAVPILPGEIAIATGHSHMCVRRVAGRLTVRSSAKPAASGCLPSVDPMLSSLAQTCEGRVLAIILSGMGRDGFDGASQVVDAGGTVWAQNADTCAVWGMPGAVYKAGLTSLVARPENLGQAIMRQFADTTLTGTGASAGAGAGAGAGAAGRAPG